MNELVALVGSVAAVLLLTSFVKIFTALTIMRQGIGLNGGGFGLVLAGLAFVLSMVVVFTPQLEILEVKNLSGLISLFGGASDGVHRDGAKVQAAFTPFLESRTDSAVLTRFDRLAKQASNTASVSVSPSAGAESAPQTGTVVPEVPKSTTASRPFTVTLAAFIVSELRVAFQLGLILLIPFLVIDLLVINILMALGITQVGPTTIALPLKLLLFVAIDGWALLTSKLII